MGTSGSNTLIMATYDDLQKLINKEYADLKIQAFISRFDNVLVGTKEIAKFHSVNEVRQWEVTTRTACRCKWIDR